MSVRVMSLVWQIALPDSEKLVLLALADCANDEGGCWPSMKTLSDKCSKSDRTVQAAIKSLVEKGHLSRIERIGKGCHYYVHPIQPTGMQGTHPVVNHYTYRITCTETGEFYLGARSSYDDPKVDKYMGSGDWIKKAKSQRLTLTKEIIEIYPSREALAVGEQELTKALCGHPLCRNKKVASVRNLSLFGGDRPEAASPRSGFAPKGTTLTPEGNDADPRNGFGQTINEPLEPPNKTLRSSASDDAHELVDDWNSMASDLGLPKVAKLTEQRKRAIRSRLKQNTMDEWREAFRAIRRSRFVQGDNERGWKADFDFLLQPKSFTRLIEGFYDGKV